MKKYQNFHHLQIRFPEKHVAPGMKLTFHGSALTLGDAMPQTLGRTDLPIGAVVNGYTMQFELLREGRRAGAAWFYCYGSVEGSQWAVLDEMELYDTAAAS